MWWKKDASPRQFVHTILEIRTFKRTHTNLIHLPTDQHLKTVFFFVKVSR